MKSTVAPMKSNFAPVSKFGKKKVSMLNYDSADDQDKSYHLEPDDDIVDKSMAQIDD